MDLVGAECVSADRPYQGIKQCTCPADPIGKGRAIKVDPLAGINLALTIQGKVIAVLCRSADYAEQLRTKPQKHGIYKHLQSIEFGIVSGKRWGGGLGSVCSMSYWQRKISLGSIEGPLSAILESYATALNEERYSHESFLSKTWFVIGFSRWLHQEAHHDAGSHARHRPKILARQAPQKRRSDDAEAFLDVDAQPRTHTGARHFGRREKSEVDKLVEEYSVYLLNERGLASTSGVAYAAIAHRFLTRTCPRGRSDLKALTALRIRDFTTARSTQVSNV